MEPNFKGVLCNLFYFDPKHRFKTHNWIDPWIAGIGGTLGHPPPFPLLVPKTSKCVAY